MVTARTCLMWTGAACLLLLCGGTCMPQQGDVTFDEEGTNPLAPPLEDAITYGVDSPFNQAIPENAAVDPNSEVYVRNLQRWNRPGFLITTRFWSAPVFYADASAPRFDVRLTANWRPSVGGRQVNYLVDVPIPEAAKPDPEDDGQMAIVDLETGFEYDLWQVQRTAEGWEASWGNRIPLDGRGIYPTGYSARGSGFGLLAGILWPEELVMGSIDHAILCTLSDRSSAGGGPVAPATESDGLSLLPGALPEGARVQLDPALDLDAPSLGLTPLEKVVARALQEYGMFLGDQGGSGITLQAIQMGSFAANPYRDLVTTEYVEDGYILLSHIPMDRLRVLRLPPQQPNAPLALADESIYR